MNDLQAAKAAIDDGGKLLFVTGAGLSADSGLPTFRGKDGYWTEGSRVYHPMELATKAAFMATPKTVWDWYDHRHETYNKASANQAHRAIAEAQRKLGDRCVLLTQNVDGLHNAALSPPDSTYEIHGNLAFVRCFADCGYFAPRYEVPGRSCDWFEFSEAECPDCGARLRPHVLWFDEGYTQRYYRAVEALAEAEAADVIVFVGTMLETSLPWMIATHAAFNFTTKVVWINTNDTLPQPLSAEYTTQLRGRAVDVVPGLVEYLTLSDGATLLRGLDLEAHLV